MCRDVGVALPKPQKQGGEMGVCRKDRACKHYTNNSIPTSFFFMKHVFSY